MKPSKIGILLVLMLFVGICGLLYPSVSQYWNSKTQTRAVENYREILESLQPEDYEAFFQEAEAYNQALHDLRGMLIALAVVCLTFIITIVVFVTGYTQREKNWLDTLQRVGVTDGVHEHTDP